ncbi:phosphonoacetaldehyde hydrolase [Fusibacter ferrireducens]|uniref:Phosphonoacetaldehyde hydrolase n=1 Tax=Fusibacter ferrireducens TaxID=2785058 RepID=A0ABR9ZYN8_9FIRM|nr:phosphonoacetaldehyde hydrolase [Fusibacter ferrireducens]MBF4695567.1 phosphonoacetaldehyde hydrolase [Fusibacter ferrireducens]
MKSNDIQAVILDWAGTTLDYGCMAPLHVFQKIFEEKGIQITEKEAREPMGLGKFDHICALLNMERIALAWQTLYGKKPDQQDGQALYEKFVPALMENLSDYTTLLDGVLEVIEYLRANQIKIGSTTGYTRQMMDVVEPLAKQQGYQPDCIVTPDHLPAGRPAPFMCFQNAIALNVQSMKHIIKAGDTISDIKEGVNAGCWTVGILEGSSELGLSPEALKTVSTHEFYRLCNETRKRYYEAGAHYVIQSIRDLPWVVATLNSRET